MESFAVLAMDLPNSVDLCTMETLKSCVVLARVLLHSSLGSVVLLVSFVVLLVMLLKPNVALAMVLLESFAVHGVMLPQSDVVVEVGLLELCIRLAAMPPQ